MSHVQRCLKLDTLLQKKSLFLFGPRATGKSTLIDDTLADKTVLIDLLDGRVAIELAAAPYNLEAIIGPKLEPSRPWIVIDEIQKIPALLDEVHRLIERRRMRFLLTGSSARKLKRGAANLLGGRAWEANLFPLTTAELKNFNLERFLRFGGLPPVYLSTDPQEELDAYVNTYLREEILAEGLIRKLPPFARFLKSIALCHGQLINYAGLSSDTAVSASTLREYVSILVDTLVGFVLEPWVHSHKRKAIQTAKFYFFDIGVRNTLAGLETLDRTSNAYGVCFETFIGMELRAYLRYGRRRESLSFWRSTSNFEVDFVIGNKLAVEVKASTHVTERDLRGLNALSEEKAIEQYILVSQDPLPRAHKLSRGATALLLPWQEFLSKMWNDELLT